MKFAFLLATLVIGCSHNPRLTVQASPIVNQPWARQGEAMQIVWFDYFKQTVKPPKIVWRSDKCPIPGSENTPSVVVNGKCYYGYADIDYWTVYIAWQGSFSKSAFAHELIHCIQALKGIQDLDHKLTEWWIQTRGAHRKLQAVGL